MADLQISGVIQKIFDTHVVSENFKKREFILESGTPEYPEYIKMEFTQDKTGILDNYKVNDPVQISFNLKGRKWVDHKVPKNGSTPYKHGESVMPVRLHQPTGLL